MPENRSAIRLASPSQVATAPRIARSRDGGTPASFDFGGGYSLTRDLHVDAGIMLGLNQRTPDLAFTVGLSVRL